MKELGATSSDKRDRKPSCLPEDTISHPPDLHEERECMIPQADGDRLQFLHDKLVHEINRPDKLANHLYSEGAMTQMEMEDVQAKESRYKQVQELLNIVPRKSQHTFTTFTKALCFYNQRDLAEKVANKQLEISESYYIYR